MSPDDRETIPDFLVERLENQGEATLRDIADYARDPRGITPEAVPDNIADPIFMQSPEVCMAVANYAEALANGTGDADTGGSTGRGSRTNRSGSTGAEDHGTGAGAGGDDADGTEEDEDDYSDYDMGWR